MLRSCKACVVWALFACAGTVTLPTPSSAQTGSVMSLPIGSQTKIRMGFDSFADTEAINVVSKQMLEKLGYIVDIQLFEPAVLYASVASGKLDVSSSGNLPNNHKDYWAKFGAHIVKVGPFHNELRIGMAVPDYVDVNSIADLKGREGEFGNKIIGNTPSSGNMRQTANAIKVYGLDMKLVESSSAAQSAAMAKAIAAHEKIVFPAWSPNWWWGKWKLKWLADPKSAYAPVDGWWHLVRIGLDKDAPRAFAFFQNYKMTAADQSAIMLKIVDGTKADDAARDFIDEHPDLVKKWLGN